MIPHLILWVGKRVINKCRNDFWQLSCREPKAVPAAFALFFESRDLTEMEKVVPAGDTIS